MEERKKIKGEDERDKMLRKNKELQNSIMIECKEKMEILFSKKNGTKILIFNEGKNFKMRRWAKGSRNKRNEDKKIKG